MIRHLELDPTVDYQGRVRDIVRGFICPRKSGTSQHVGGDLHRIRLAAEALARVIWSSRGVTPNRNEFRLSETPVQIRAPPGTIADQVTPAGNGFSLKILVLTLGSL